jgi:hypothetical protein
MPQSDNSKTGAYCAGARREFRRQPVSGRAIPASRENNTMNDETKLVSEQLALPGLTNVEPPRLKEELNDDLPF